MMIFGLGRHVFRASPISWEELGFSFIRTMLETFSKLAAANRLYVRFGLKPFAADHVPARAGQLYSLDLTK